jgi:GNAT superfamily N-acetyltransferase
MTLTFTVRRAVLADAAALPAIERSAAELFRLDPSLGWLAEAEVPEAAQHLLAIEHAFVWVAENSDREVVSFLRALEIDQQLHIEELSVSQHCQGQGIGRALVLVAIEHAHQQALRAVTLATFRDLPWNAPFYQRLGFNVLVATPIDQHLIEALQAEIAIGFPGERRCAMRLPLP